MTSFKKGIFAEQRALSFLEKQGYVLLEKRFRTPFGEIDLILHQKELLLFVEVKQRATLEKALYSLSVSQKKRLRYCAEYFIKIQPLFYATHRFDFIALSSSGDLQHLCNITLEP